MKPLRMVAAARAELRHEPQDLGEGVEIVVYAVRPDQNATGMPARRRER